MKSTLRRLAPLSILLTILVTTLLVTSQAFASPEQEKASFIEEMTAKHGFDAETLSSTLGQAEIKQSILDAIARPAEKRLTWTKYRNIFIKPARISGGVDFIKANKKALDDAHDKYGVPPEIITAIIGVETLYGKHTGGYRVLDALTTLGFHYPPRSKFFRSELSNFLQLTRDEGINPTEPTGSYAGAMGKPQFIPSSYRHYAIDFDNDGKRDIWNNNVDVIGSVANYFSRHGWRKDHPVTVQAKKVTPESHDNFINAGMKPSIMLGKLDDAGIEYQGDFNSAQNVSLVELKLDQGEEYWIGMHNFYVITRYNHSNMYAMAVYQLSQEIRKAMEKS
jgi:membrane-bound lytic murein transglycosylase B